MEEEHPVIGFGLEYAGDLVYCEAVMNENSYGILFNGKWIASIEHTDDWNWIQASGVILPEEVVEEIGLRIESQYK